MRVISRFLVVGGLALALGCAGAKSGVPTEFLNPSNRLTVEEGSRILENGHRLEAEAAVEIEDANDRLKAGKAKKKEAKKLIERGEQAIHAAAMSEEAARMQLEAQRMRQEALLDE